MMAASPRMATPSMLTAADVLPASSAGPMTTAVAAPVTNPLSGDAGHGQGDLHSVSAEVLGLVFSDVEHHVPSSLEGDDLGSALAELLSGLDRDQ